MYLTSELFLGQLTDMNEVKQNSSHTGHTVTEKKTNKKTFNNWFSKQVWNFQKFDMNWQMVNI